MFPGRGATLLNKVLALPNNEVIATCKATMLQKASISELSQRHLHLRVLIRVLHELRAKLVRNIRLFIDKNAEMRAILNCKDVELWRVIRLCLINKLVERSRFLEASQRRLTPKEKLVARIMLGYY